MRRIYERYGTTEPESAFHLQTSLVPRQPGSVAKIFHVFAHERFFCVSLQICLIYLMICHSLIGKMTLPE